MVCESPKACGDASKHVDLPPAGNEMVISSFNVPQFDGRPSLDGHLPGVGGTQQLCAGCREQGCEGCNVRDNFITPSLSRDYCNCNSSGKVVPLSLLKQELGGNAELAAEVESADESDAELNAQIKAIDAIASHNGILTQIGERHRSRLRYKSV
jgi:hypothetical protein